MKRDLVVFQPASVAVHDNPLTSAAAQVARIGRPLWELAPVTPSPLMLRLNGLWVLRADWWRPVLPGDVIEWHVLPMGGAGSRQVLTLVALVAIAYLTSGSSLLAGSIGAAGAAAVGVVASIAAVALINALIPIQQPSLGTTQSPGSVYNVQTAANQARINAPIPVQYGRMLRLPDYAGQPYAEFANNDQFFMAVYCVGQGEYDVERLLIDDTPLDHFQDVEYEILQPGQLPTLALANVVTAPEVTGQTLDTGRRVGGFAACAPTLTAASIGIDVLFPKGLGLADSGGSIKPLSAVVQTEARRIDDFGVPADAWYVLGVETVTASTSLPQRRSFPYDLATPGRYEVRMVRRDPRNASLQALHDVQWGGMRAYLADTAPLCPTATHFAVRLRASEQLSGLSQRKIGGIWRRKVRTWSPTAGWSAPVQTRNPMWARLDKLTSSVYGDGLSDDRIDLVTHANLAAIYDARQDHLDILFDSKVTSIDADRTICVVGRAVPFQRAGVCTVARDQLQTLPVTAYSSRDMLPGSLSIGYALATEVTADGVNLEYFDNRAWDWRSVMCPAPGVTVPQNAVTQRVQGITGRKHANREGLYSAAQNVYRRKFPKFTTEMQGRLPAYGCAVVLSPALPGWGQAGDVAFWDAGTRTMVVTEPLQFTNGARHFVSVLRDNGSLSDAIGVTPGTTANEIVLDSAPLLANGAAMTLVVDDPTRERPKFIFGAEGEHRMIARVLGISPKGKGDDGATTIEISTVAEDVRVHQVDNALLPGPGEVQDSVDAPAQAANVTFDTIVNIDARVNKTAAGRGIRVGGIDPNWTLVLDLPPGQTFAGWSEWASDHDKYVPNPPNAWGNLFEVIDDEGLPAMFGENAIASSAELARQAFTGGTLTGSAGYTFSFPSDGINDNRGGLSIRLSRIA